MTSYEKTEEEMLAVLRSHDPASDEATKIVKNLKVLSSCKVPPAPPPEPKESWLSRHSDALIKGAFGFAGVVAIVLGEKLGNHIYNTKAWGTVPK